MEGILKMLSRCPNSHRSGAFVPICVGVLIVGMTAFAPNLRGEYAERMGMIESSDHGATWQFKGHADFHAPALNPEDLGVTNYTAGDYRQPGRPWGILHQNKLYVSFDVDSVDAATGEERLKGQAVAGVYEILGGSSAVGRRGENPTGFRLEQNYPNPFNPSTTIRFDLPQAEHVRLAVQDLLGREIAVLVDEKRMQGTNEARWDGLDARGWTASSDVYLYKLDAAQYRRTGKCLLMR